MKRVFRSEWFQFSRSPMLWLAIIVILVADLFLNSRTQVTSANLYDLPRLCTTSQFTNYAENASMSVRGAIQYFSGRDQIEEIPQDQLIRLYEADDINEVFYLVQPYQFRWVLAATKGMLFIPLLFGLCFLGIDIQRRSHLNAIYLGYRRGQIFAAKTLYLFLITFIASLAGICLLTGIYANTVFSRLPSGYVWSRLLIHALADTALIAPAYLLAVLVRKFTPTGFVLIAYDVLLWATNIVPLKKAMSDMEVWREGGDLLPIALWSIGTIVVCVVLCWLRERKISLK